MPIIKSAKKRMKQQDAKRLYNVAVKNAVKKHVKAVKTEVASGKVTSQTLVAAVAQLDTAVRKGVLHKRTADRKKSRLSKEYNSLATKPYGTENPAKTSTKKKAAGKPVAKKAAAKKPTSK